MPHTETPLRYPGGKTQLAKFVAYTIAQNNIINPTYCEPFAGGFGVAINLLFNHSVKEVILNDYDPAIYSFWYAIIYDSERFIKKIVDTPVNIDEWKTQHEIYNKYNNVSKYNFELAFATFFLNRTNRSGIISGGPIGGLHQNGKYHINCRYNKENLINKINKISSNKDNFHLYNLDAIKFIRKILPKYKKDNLFIFFDPPYYQQGKKLYKNFFDEKKHQRLSQEIKKLTDIHWITTYDDAPSIRALYCETNIQTYCLQYFANKKRKEKELIFHSPCTRLFSYDKIKIYNLY